MTYLKSLFFNFLVVFFANHVLPGIDVVNQTKLPHFGGDLPFALVLGFLNSLIYPALKIFKQPVTILRLAIIAFVLNFIMYALLKLFAFIGIQIEFLEGYLLAVFVVTCGSFLTNYLEYKHRQHQAVHHAHHMEHTEHTHHEHQ